MPTTPTPPQPPQVNTEQIREELRQDGLLGKKDKAFTLQLTGKSLLINGEQQSAAMADKYRKLLGDGTDARGTQSTNSISISVNE